LQAGADAVHALLHMLHPPLQCVEPVAHLFALLGNQVREQFESDVLGHA
jgi:hypothetical protein